jgi:antitoxin component YwqK of YwqJK toxin-antitoxin module
MFMSNEPEVQKEFYDNGKLKKETHYKNGKQDGLETIWYESGKKKSEKHYEVGIEIGIRKIWNKDGKLTYGVCRRNHIDGVEEIR